VTGVAALLAGLALAVALGWPEPRRSLGPAVPVVLPGWLLVVPGAGLVVLLGPAGGLVLVVLGIVARRAWRERQRTRGRAAERAGAVEALAVLGTELRVGRPPSDALAVAASVAVGPFAVGPFAGTLQVASRSLTIGADPVAALRDGAATSAAPDALRGLAACVEVCASSGSSLALAVETVADAMRTDHRQRLVVEAELAGPRATALMLAGLPVAGTLLAAGLGARPLHVLLHTAVGGACLVVGVGLDLLGLWWTGRLVAAASP
jgi:tight adherence protein B